MATLVQGPRPQAPRVKRKPPPRLDITERYPPPDPHDPLAPLSVLRSRASALLGLPPSQENLIPMSVPCRRTSFQLYPASPVDLDDPFLASPGSSNAEDLTRPLTPPRKLTGEAHYRRRSQSILGLQNPHRYATTLPHPLDPTPSLIRDTSGDSSGTDIESDDVLEKSRSISPLRGRRNSSRGRIAQFLKPGKKTSQMSINSACSTSSSGGKPRGKTSLSSISISSPISIPAASESIYGFPPSHSRNSRLPGADSLPHLRTTASSSSAIVKHARHPSDSSDDCSSHDNERDNGYYSQPERPSSISYRLAKQSLGSSTTKCVIVPNVQILPSTPTVFTTPVEQPHSTSSPPRSVNSCHSSSSYVNVSVPSSVADHGSSDRPGTPKKHFPPRRHNNALPSTGNSSSLFLPLARTKPLSSPSTPVLPKSPSSSQPPCTSSYKFPFRRSSSKASTIVAVTPTKSSIRSLKISNPTLISPEPQIATRALPGGLSPVSVDCRHGHSPSSSTSTDDSLVSTSVPQPVQSEENPAVTNSTSPDPQAPSNPVPNQASVDDALPSAEQLANATSFPLITESGVRVSLGSLLPRHASSVLIVVFVRHFWCPVDQDYVQQIVDYFKSASQTNDEQHVELVIISNGPHTLITKYRQMFGMPMGVKVLTDPSLRVYGALGMHALGDGCEEPALKSSSTSTSVSNYPKRGLLGGIATVVMRALKVGIPVGEKGGETRQLGGEFVFNADLSCTYAHRMKTTRDHTSMEELFQAAGFPCIGASEIPPSRATSPPVRRPSTSPSPRPTFTIPGHPYACTEHVPRTSTPSSVHVRRRTESLTSGSNSKARKARVRASTIWSVDVKEYDAEESRRSEDESERWKRNLIKLREGLGAKGGDDTSSRRNQEEHQSTGQDQTLDPDLSNASGTFSADFHERSLTSETTHDHDTAQLLEQTKSLLMSRAMASSSLIGVLSHANEQRPRPEA
ncbi:hypothetical protein VNI00_013611 [Paramarasmius palmivorus]|uniref:Uncharacterized protein n=1 Tax=Paramarasmius palmivorus TaxID=297713 RepID=A0AAW0BYB7_9AGAR